MVITYCECNIYDARGNYLHTRWMNNEQMADHIRTSRGDFETTGRTEDREYPDPEPPVQLIIEVVDSDEDDPIDDLYF